jgi:hypothetical protein
LPIVGTTTGERLGPPHAFRASRDLLHRLGQIGEIADTAMAARHAVHLDAHLLGALHQRGRAGIGRWNLRRRPPGVGHKAELRVRDVGDDVAGGVRIIERVCFNGAAALGGAPLAVDAV